MDLKSIVSKVAPVLGTALGGQAGGLVGALISSAFGGNKNPDDLAQVIANDPEAAIKLKSIEYQHMQELERINALNYQTEVDDRKSARQMQVDSKSYMPAVLAISFVVIYACIQYFVISNPGGQDDVISARVQDILVMIISFYFGSSHNQRRKP